MDHAPTILNRYWTIQFKHAGKWHPLNGWERFISTDEAAMRDFDRLVGYGWHDLRLVSHVTLVHREEAMRPVDEVPVEKLQASADSRGVR